MPKVILISGGSDGLGKAIAQKLVNGNQVIILAHNKTKLETAAKEVGCDYVEAEMTDYASLKIAVDQVVSKYQKIDVLVNNAGIWIEGQLDQNDPIKIKEVIDINTTGTILLSKLVLPQMRTQKSGQIVNIISQDGLCAKKDRSVYHASKWAITGFTKCLQDDLEEENIKVTAVYPGLIKTSLFQKSNASRDLSQALDPTEVASVVQYVINLSQTIHIPEITIKNKTTPTQNMDDTNSPVIDLNMDPNMISPQDGSPQAVPANQPTSSAPIDITPGNQSVSPEPASTPLNNHLSDLLPQPEPEPVAAPDTTTPSPAIEPPVASPAITSTPVVSSPIPQPQVMSEPLMSPEPTPIPETPVSTNPLYEDPDLVKPTK
ncbi:MAG TPA: SDR family NAD(P)-dependent oxidoreductase [Candidatus Woesebacteria bacterium]|nr:SDR family NAD(P)-dependent oxidoreductase [Candidatus Woesebacteria bacterium]